MRTTAAAKFKATCLAVMDEIQKKQESVLITKNGKPVAKMVPLATENRDPIFGFYRGKLDIQDDVVSQSDALGVGLDDRERKGWDPIFSTGFS